MPALEQKLAEAQKKSEERADKPSNSLVRDTVTKEEIAGIVAKWTGIPVAKLVEGEREKILHLDEILHRRVVGQEEAVTKVTERPEPADWFLSVPGSYGCGKNGTG